MTINDRLYHVDGLIDTEQGVTEPLIWEQR